ncbi:MAG TPA: heavy metal-associated domain-containing protein [Candidatus Eremiobacteraceae bacterium]|nr:heavy metal-associated domain-containing protein [Candidatus Eremiobacteraceae bacterium]
MTARSQDIVIEIADMRSAVDVEMVRAALCGIAGVTDAIASLGESLATVTADPTVATPDMLRAAIAAAGFTPGDVRFPE